MFKNLLIINFIVSCFLGLGIYLAQKLAVKLPLFINNYLNDFLIIPIVLTLCLYILRLTRNNKAYILPLGVVLFLCFGYALFFEVFMPKISTRYTGDFYDVIAYFLGGVWFLGLQNIRLSFKNRLM